MNCKIVGYEYKTLEVTLSPGESIYAERGKHRLMWMRLCYVTWNLMEAVLVKVG